MKSVFKIFLAVVSLMGAVLLALLWGQISHDRTLAWSLAAFDGLLLILAAATNLQALKDAWRAWRFYQIGARASNLLLTFCILGLVNYLAFKHPWQLDFSPGKLNTLSDQTARVLKSLESPVKLTAVSVASERAPLLALAELYRMQKSDVEIDHIDLEKRPDLAQSYHLTTPAAMLVSYGGREQLVTEISELQITNALIVLSSGKATKLYATTGHGELDFARTDKEGASTMAGILKAQAFEVIPLALAQTSEIPADASALMIWGPRKGFLAQELDILRSFINKGGTLVVALDPQVGEDHIAPLRSLLAEYGVGISNGLVVDSISHVSGSSGSIPIVKKFNKTHQATKDIQGQVFFPFASSITSVPTKHNGVVSFHSLADSSTYPASWMETDMAQVKSGKVTFEAGKDAKGPQSMAGTFERYLDKGGQQRIVAFGNSTLVLNAYANMTDNFTLVTNSISWSLGQGRLISFDLPALADPSIALSAMQMNAALAFSVFLAPLVFLALALAVYRHRLKG